MRRRLRLAAAVAAAAPACAGMALGAPATAQAVSVGASAVDCPNVLNFSFSPWLTLGFSSGQVTQTYSSVCASTGAGGSTDGPLFPLPVGQGTFVYVPDSAFSGTVSFSGSCVLATTGMIFWGDSSQNGLLVGGSVFVGVPPTAAAENGLVYTEVDVLAPFTPCNENAAIGAGSDPGLFAFAF